MVGVGNMLRIKQWFMNRDDRIIFSKHSLEMYYPEFHLIEALIDLSILIGELLTVSQKRRQR